MRAFWLAFKSVTGLVAGWMYAIVVICLALALGTSMTHGHLLRVSLKEEKAERAIEKQERTDAALKSEQDERSKETRRAKAIEEIQNENAKLKAANAASVTRARNASERLRVVAQDAAARARGSCANPGAAAGGKGEPDSDPIGMFAIVQRRLDEAAGRIGKFADDNRAAGQVCEAYAAALKEKP